MKKILRDDPSPLLLKIDDEINTGDFKPNNIYKLLLDLKRHITHTEAVLDEIQRIGAKHTC